MNTEKTKFWNLGLRESCLLFAAIGIALTIAADQFAGELPSQVGIASLAIGAAIIIGSALVDIITFNSTESE